MHHSKNLVKFIIEVIRTSTTTNLLGILVMSLSMWARFSTILMNYRGSQAACLIDVSYEHAPVKSKILKRASIPYMNSQLRKAIYRRNMAQNKFRKYGSTYWEVNRIQRNKVVAIRKASIAKYFSQKFSSHDKSFWSTVSPFMTDKGTEMEIISCYKKMARLSSATSL